MESQTKLKSSNLARSCGAWDPGSMGIVHGRPPAGDNPALLPLRNHRGPNRPERLLRAPSETNATLSPMREAPMDCTSMSLLEFVQRKFIPEYVATRKYAGRSHFGAILKHVLTPEQVTRAFGRSSENTSLTLKTIDGWPYMDSLQLCEITGERIQTLISAVLQSGYSIQTATHVRNVIRTIFSHAIATSCYTGTNPASLVTLPAMARKKAHSLTLVQLKQIMQAMRYPEKGISLLALLTEMNVAEICGLQWKYVNLSNVACLVEEDSIPPRTISVRMQSYRGQFGPVSGKRKRLIPVSDLLGSILSDLGNRKHFTAPQDFVLASQNGTPIYPENIAARRLKSIGKAFDMPWLSWTVFHRTHVALESELGRHLHKEYQRALPLHNLATRHWPSYSGLVQRTFAG